MTENIKENLTLTLVLEKGLRVAWVVLLTILSVVFIAGIPSRFEELATICPADPCTLTLQASEAAILAKMGIGMPIFAAYHILIEFLSAAFLTALAVFFFWRRFDEPMGILLAFMLVPFSLNFMVESDGAFIKNYPQLVDIEIYITSLTSIPLLLLIFLFPDGRFVPKKTRYILPVIIIVALLNPILVKLGLSSPSGQISYPAIILTPLILIIGVGTQIYRYRKVSNLVQRQQTKWVIIGFAALLVPILGWSIFIELFPPPPGSFRLFIFTVFYGIMAAFLIFFPVSFVIAITRYRLWDIDVLIHRTLVYSLLTSLLLLVYFGSVVVVQTAVNGITGQEQTSQFTIALSTLLIAALFNPLRRGIQAFIDRRFYRRKYDAAQTLAEFAATARDEVDAERLSVALLKVVEETMQPEQTSLWLK